MKAERNPEEWDSGCGREGAEAISETMVSQNGSWPLRDTGAPRLLELQALKTPKVSQVAATRHERLLPKRKLAGLGGSGRESLVLWGPMSLGNLGPAVTPALLWFPAFS